MDAAAEVHVEVHEGGQSRGREAITSGHTEVPVNVYRTTHPPIFAGFQINWIEGNDPETGTTFDINAGAGLGSKYATISVEIPGQPRVYEYIDITELLQHRVMAIIAEMSNDGNSPQGTTDTQEE